MFSRHLGWLLAFDDARPSPFGPLLEVWLRGAWPIVLAGDEVLVYVPVEQNGRVAPWMDGDPLNLEAEDPFLVRHGPRRRPVAAEQSTALPAWWQLGLSLPPAYEVEDRRAEIDGDIAWVGPYPVEPDEPLPGAR